MKRFFLALVMLFVVPAVANAEMYVAARVGLAMPDITQSNSFLASVINANDCKLAENNESDTCIKAGDTVDNYTEIGKCADMSGGIPVALTCNDGKTDMARTAVQNDAGTTFAGAVAVGYRFWQMRAELEANYRTQSKIDKSDDLTVQNMYGLFNLYYDFPVASEIFKPYISAGVGYGTTDVKMIDTTKSASALAWQFGLGIAFQLSDHWAIDLGVRRVDNGTWKYHFTIPSDDGGISGKATIKTRATEITLGARWMF